MKKILILAFAALLCTGMSAQNWTSLFNGKNLKGWKQVSGTAKYTVKDGCIIGTCKDNANINSFLATKASYSDFILEFEFKMDESQNSGVQFRSHLNGDGRVYGYQYEFDPSERAWSAGVYDESRRGWLYPLTFNQAARKAFIHNDWNKGRIECIGNHIRTFLNGVLVADVIDDKDSEGFIALQVHLPGNVAERIGTSISWKNIRICTQDPAAYCIEAAPIHQVNKISNTLSERQAAEGWKLLWDGKTTNGWASAKGEGLPFPKKGWSIEGDELRVAENGGAESTNGGDIMTVDKFTNFWLSVDFFLTKGANSGIKYFINPDLYPSDASAIGCEFQILDDKVHPDAKLGVAGNRTLGSLYDLIRADKDEAYFRMGQWNTAWVIVRDNHVEHWLNGVKVVEYDRNNQMFNALVQCSKFRERANFGNHKSGHVLLQDHGNEVHYQNIMIKEL
ncbi:MAG: DUF1080 domain-containing protein [Bacteroidales bacterium]|nr:DUF1080 domain-containing protein [Bacteroidales bacterium]